MTQEKDRRGEEVAEAVPVAVEVHGGRLWVALDDGRVIGTPLNWYLTLANATATELSNYELFDETIHWPDLDEDLSIHAMLAGKRPRYPWTTEQWRARVEALRDLQARYGPDATILTPIDMTDPLDASVTVREIAEDYGLSTDAVYQAIRRKRLPAQRSGATWLIRRRDAEALWGAAERVASTPKHHFASSLFTRNLADIGEIERRRQEIQNTILYSSHFSVSRAAIRKGKLHITAKKKQDASLAPGNTLLVVDSTDWMPMGVFRVSEERQTEYDAVATNDVDPLLKGYVMEKGKVSQLSHMTAIRVP